MKTLVAVALLFTGGLAQAEVVPCREADGRVIYREAPCSDTSQRRSSVAPRPAHIVTVPDPIAPKPASRVTIAPGITLEMPQASNTPPQPGAAPAQCQFKYFGFGDAKGKALADSAKQECLENIEHKHAGRPTSLQAYNMWRDHFSSERDHRNAVMDRVQRR